MIKEEEAIEKIDKKLDTTEDEEITVNLLYKKIDLLEDILKQNSAEIEKYKSLYNKALEDLVKAEKKNMQKDKQRDLMLKYINYLSDELVQATGRNELEFCNGNKCCIDSDYSCEQCIKQYFKQKATNNG